MYSSSQLKQAAPPLLIVLVSLAFLPLQAVVPPPDGGYPGGNTAEGQKALLSLTGGVHNTAIGFLSLETDAAGNFNTAVGSGTLWHNTADANTATGAFALLLNMTAPNNTAVGAAALLFNIGEGNTATGAFAMYSNTEGHFDTANGEFALYFNTTGERNTAIGDSALYSNTEGDRNTAVGNAALLLNTAGTDNTAVGTSALADNDSGGFNVAVGANALSVNGQSDNTAVGAGALSSSTGDHNTAVGTFALVSSSTANFNVALGDFALQNDTSGNGNVAVGSGAGLSVTTANNVICIGTPGQNMDNSCFIDGIFGQPGGMQAVYVDSSGKLGALVSSRRFKKDIRPMNTASEALFALEPVTFHYKKQIDPAGARNFGLVAEDVEKVNPDLVLHDKEGKPHSVRYDQVNAMLLNEFLKEHRKVEEQAATIAQLKKTIDIMLARLDEHDSKIQGVSDQVKMTQARQVVLSQR